MGKYVVLALENEPDLLTLQLRHPKSDASLETNDPEDNAIVHVYGDKENTGKTFQL